MGCTINLEAKFDRKHYFYPDLPKSYQITQYDMPFCKRGVWTNSKGKTIHITRIHLEEDTGKLLHKTVNGESVSFIDFNRSGVPLIELVTEPEFADSLEVVEFLKEIQKLVRSLGISSADMEKGSMRLEANISLLYQKANPPNRRVKVKSQKLPDYKVELKNINSFRFLASAIDSEIARQAILLRTGDRVLQETRGFDAKHGKTFSQRSKEEAKDYRYFPEPDLPPIRLSQKDITALRQSLPELPSQMYTSLLSLGVPEKAAKLLSANKTRYLFLREVRKLDSRVDLALVANLMVNKNADVKFGSPKKLLESLTSMSQKLKFDTGQTAKVVDEVLSENPKAVADFRGGKANAVGYLVGKFMQKSRGRGDPKAISKIISAKLANND